MYILYIFILIKKALVLFGTVIKKNFNFATYFNFRNS